MLEFREKCVEVLYSCDFIRQKKAKQLKLEIEKSFLGWAGRTQRLVLNFHFIFLF